MKRKVSIQKGFVFGVTAVAVIAVLTGAVLRMTNISASTESDANANSVSTCYRPIYFGSTCPETMAHACTRTEPRATKTAAELTDAEKTKYGEKAKAWNIGINNGNPLGVHRLVIGAKKVSGGSSVRVDFGLTPMVTNWGGNSDSIYLIFNDGMGYKKTYNLINKLTTYSSYIIVPESTGDIDVLFLGKHEDGCLKNVINMNQVFAGTSPSPTPPRSQTASPSQSPGSDGTTSGFESGTDGWTAHNATISQSSDFAHSGTKSLKVTNTEDHGSARHSFTTVAGQNYQVSAWVYNAISDARLWVGTAVNQGDLLRLTPKTNSGWQQISGNFVAKGTKTYIEYRPAGTVTRATSYMDDFSLKAVSITSTAAPAISLEAVGSVDTATLKPGAKIEYFKGKDLTDSIVAEKIESVNFNWGNQSPETGVPKDNWSDKITSKIKAPETGDYRIGVVYNDAARVWLGGKRIIDDWTDWADCPTSTPTCDNETQVKKASVLVRMEKDKLYNLSVNHYDNTDKAVLKLFWKLPSQATGTMIPATAFTTSYTDDPAQGTGTGLLGTYYGSKDLENSEFWRKDAQINFNWGSGVPRKELSNGNFSVRWTGKIRPRFSEKYTFSVTSKDGVRVKVNDELIIDQWKDVTQATTYTGDISLTGEKLYPISIEYYSSSAPAQIDLKWQSPTEKLELVPTTALYYPGAPDDSTSVVPPSSALKMTVKPGWNAISIPKSSVPVLAGPLRVDPYNFLTFAFNGTRQVKEPNGQTLRDWNNSPQVFYKRMGYYIKNTSNKDEIITFDESTDENKAIVYKGWNLLSNPEAGTVKLSEMEYNKKTCTDGGTDPIHCDGYFNAINLGQLTYGKLGEGKSAYQYVYYIAKPNADSNTPDPFDIYDVKAAGGPSEVSIPGHGIFWLYLFD